MPSVDVWSQFAHDPRRSEHATLRASDHDRTVVEQALAEAYAEGRLTREEHDERTTRVQASLTLADLPPLLSDLVPDRSTPPMRRNDLGLASPGELDRMALERYQEQRVNALMGFLAPSLICVVVWVATGADAIFWPAFVMAGTVIPLLRLLVARQTAIDGARRELEKEQARELRKRKYRELGD